MIEKFGEFLDWVFENTVHCFDGGGIMVLDVAGMGLLMNVIDLGCIV